MLHTHPHHTLILECILFILSRRPKEIAVSQIGYSFTTNVSVAVSHTFSEATDILDERVSCSAGHVEATQYIVICISIANVDIVVIRGADRIHCAQKRGLRGGR